MSGLGSSDGKSQKFQFLSFILKNFIIMINLSREIRFFKKPCERRFVVGRGEREGERVREEGAPYDLTEGNYLGWTGQKSSASSSSGLWSAAAAAVCRMIE